MSLLTVCVCVACTPLAGVAPSPDVVTPCPPMQRRRPGERDPTLQPTDPRLSGFYVKGAGQDARGRVYVYGGLFGCSRAGAPMDVAIARLAEDGSLDRRFGDNGIACTRRGADDRLYYIPFAFAIDDQGRLVLSGIYYPSVDSFSGVVVARFDADGNPDETFGAGGFRQHLIDRSEGTPNASSIFVLAEPDGLVLAGVARGPDAREHGFVARLRTDGTPDPRFHRGEAWFDTSTSVFSSVVRTPEGYAVAGVSNTEYRPLVAMLGRDGEPVTSFGTGGVATHERRDIALMVRGLERDARGGFVLAGGIRGTQSTGLVRFNADGTTDRRFGHDDGLTQLNVPWLTVYQLDPAMTRQCDGRLLVAGNMGESGFSLARVHANGLRDGAFGDFGTTSVGPIEGTSIVHVYGVLVHPLDGRISVVTSLHDDRSVAYWRFWP